VIEHLVAHLPIGLVEAAVQKTCPKAIGQRLSCVDLVRELRPARVTARAGLDHRNFSGRGRRNPWPCRRIGTPGDARA